MRNCFLCKVSNGIIAKALKEKEVVSLQRILSIVWLDRDHLMYIVNVFQKSKMLREEKKKETTTTDHILPNNPALDLTLRQTSYFVFVFYPYFSNSLEK